MSMLNNQVGGSHYQNYKVQPITWALDNHINAAEFSILRYLLRYKNKNGLEDLNKAIHYTQILMQQTFVAKNEDAINSIVDFCIQNNLDWSACYQRSVLVALFDHDYIEVTNIIKLMKRPYE